MREETPLLFDRRKFRVALVDDQVHQAVADSLVRNLQHSLPFRAAFESAKFNFIRTRRAEFRFELIILNFGIVHADVISPYAKQVYPIIKSADPCCRH